jgi:hypothetical protein
MYLADDSEQIARWLGMLVEGESGRVVFFPGLAAPTNRMRHESRGGFSIDRLFNVDHLTLEPDRRSWHATELPNASQRRRRRGSRRSHPREKGQLCTWDLGEGSVLWFGMTIANDSALRPVMQTTTASAPAPPNREEASERLRVFERAVNGAELLVIAKPGPPPFPRAVCHFTIIVAPPTAPFYAGPLRGFSGSSGGVLTVFPDQPATKRSFWAPARVSDRIRIQIMSTWFPGEMSSKVPAVFHGRAPP